MDLVEHLYDGYNTDTRTLCATDRPVTLIRIAGPFCCFYFAATRNLALRERGLETSSESLATIGFLKGTLKSES